MKHLPLCLLGLCLANSAIAATPLTLDVSTRLPAVTGGDFDHFAVDLAHNRMYVPTEVYASIEVFDLAGQHLASQRQVAASPHKLLLTNDGRDLWIADAGAASLKIVDSTTFALKQSIPMEAQPDSGVVDEKRGILYLGNGGRNHANAYISMINLADRRVLGRIAVPATQVKAMDIDPATDRLFINFRDKNQVGIVDLATHELTGSWTVPGPCRNSAMAFDAAANRLFIGARGPNAGPAGPGKLFVLDARTGAVVQTLDIGDTSDEMIVDDANHRLYIASADGLDVVARDGKGNYAVEQHVNTLGGKTAAYVPSLHKLYVVHSKGTQAAEAGLQVFNVH